MTHSGGKPHTNVGDRGQRFEISYYDPRTGMRHVFGWCETENGATAMMDAISKHPVWTDSQRKDRRPT